MENVQFGLKKKKSSSTQGQDLRGSKNSGVVVERRPCLVHKEFIVLCVVIEASTKPLRAVTNLGKPLGLALRNKTNSL